MKDNLGLLGRRPALGALGLFSLLYFASVTGRALSKPFWYDEILTLYHARLPSLAALMQSLQRHVDFSPPVLHLLTRAAGWLPGNELVTNRLPAMLGVWVLGLCLYRLVARRLSPPYAFAALLMPMLTPIYDYAFEARGYGIVLAWSGLALVCWQSAAEGRRRPLALPGLAVCLALIPLTHYYYVCVSLAIGLAEVTRAVQRRQLDWPMLAALACSALGLPIILPLITATLDGTVITQLHEDLLALPLIIVRELFAGLALPLSLMGSAVLLSYTGWDRALPRRWIAPGAAPTVATLALGLCVIALTTSLRWTFVGGIAAVVGWRSLRVHVSSDAVTSVNQIPRYEIVLHLALIALIGLAILPAGFQIYFSVRYCLFAVIGASCLAAFTFARLEKAWPASRLTLPAVLILFVIARFGPGWQALWSPALPPVDPILTQASSDLPIVVGHSKDFMELQYRAPEPLRSRLVYLADPVAALKYNMSNIVDVGLLSLREYAPLSVYEYRPFVRSHLQFLVYDTELVTWVNRQLMEDGFRLELIATAGGKRLYRATAYPEP